MPGYDAPIRELRFLLEDVFGYDRHTPALPGFEEATLDVVMAVLDGAATFAQDVLLPINLPGDAEGCRFANGTVHTPKGYRQAYALFREGGWPALASAPEWGGQGLPPSLALMVREFVASGSMSFGMYPGLSQGAYRAILAHGTRRTEAHYLPKLVDGSWTGTMCLTEADSGTDLRGCARAPSPPATAATASPAPRSSSSRGDHDLTDNIVHLVLARLPDAPAGTRASASSSCPSAAEDARWPAGRANNVTAARSSTRWASRRIRHLRAQFRRRAGLAGRRAARGHAGDVHDDEFVAPRRGGAERRRSRKSAAECASPTPRSAGRAVAPNPAGIAPDGDGRPDHRPSRCAPHAPDDESARRRHPRPVYDAALWLDVARSPRAARKASAENRARLPHARASRPSSATGLGGHRPRLQAFGGHGYIHEHGMEQSSRRADRSALRRHERHPGTGSGASQDGIDDGKVFDWIKAASDRASTASDPLGAVSLCEALTTAMDPWMHRRDGACGRLDDGNEPWRLPQAASDYLRLFGLVALGRRWLRMAGRRSRPRAARFDPVLARKIRTARFSGEYLLDQTAWLLQRIHADPAEEIRRILMAHSAEELQ